MTRDDWRRIKEIAGGALEEPLASRAAFVATRCGPDLALRREVESLVVSATRAEALFETPAVLKAGAEAAIETLGRFDGPRARRYRQLRPVDAQADRHGYRAVRVLRRHRVRVIVAAAIAAAVIAGVARLGLRNDAAPAPASRQTRDSEAYALYLKGRHVWNQQTEDGCRRGLEYFRQAIDRDPQYALAHTGLADCYILLGIRRAIPPAEAMPQAKEAALRAIAIDGALGEAHTSLAFVYWVYDWNWEAAAAEFQRALALAPEYATAHDRYGYYPASTGRFADAIASIRRARQLEPASHSISTDLGEIYYWAGHYDEAVAELQAIVEVEPDSTRARSILGLTVLDPLRSEPRFQALMRRIGIPSSRPD